MLSRALRRLAILLLAHGLLFAGAAALASARGSIDLPGGVAEVYVFVLVVPALLLAAPLAPVLWRLRLMITPGWFAWPSPLGLALVYLTWIVVLLGVSRVVSPRARKR